MNIKQRFLNSQTTVDSFGQVTIFNNANRLTYKEDGFWYIDELKTNISTNTVAPRVNNDLYTFNGDNYHEVFGKNLELINDRLNLLSKDLTYWNLYQFTDQVMTPTDLDAVFTKLIPGKALVINCETFTNNGETYHKGDIVIKLMDQSAAKINTVASGIYFPIFCTDAFIIINDKKVVLYPFKEDDNTVYYTGYTFINNTLDPIGTSYEESDVSHDAIYHLIYQFTSVEPTANINHPQLSYDFELSKIGVDISDSFIYGIYIEDISNDIDTSDYQWEAVSKTLTFKSYEFNNEIIRPIIKFFTDMNEEIVLPFTLTYNSSTSEFVLTCNNNLVEWKKIQVK